MNHSAEKLRNEPPARKTDKQPAFKRKVVAFFVAIISLLGAVGIYLLVEERGFISPLPRAQIERNDQSRILAELGERIRGFVPTPEERGLLRKLSELHQKEARESSDSDQKLHRSKIDTKTPPASFSLNDPAECRWGAEQKLVRSTNDTKNLTASFTLNDGAVGRRGAGKNLLADTLQSFRREARVFAEKDLERYLLLGDYLASRFHDSLKKLEKSLKERGDQDVSWDDYQSELASVRKSGGGFLTRAIARGALTPNGGLDAPEITPLVVFRARWRHFAELPMFYGFSETEKVAYFDFVAAFATPSAVEKRLAAIAEIKKRRASYNSVLARAVVLHEAGLNGEALRLIEQSLAQGREDPELVDFAKALKTEI